MLIIVQKSIQKTVTCSAVYSYPNVVHTCLSILLSRGFLTAKPTKFTRTDVAITLLKLGNI